MPFHPYRIASFLAATVSLWIVGCDHAGPALGRVRGSVSVDGRPLENAVVEFQPEKGRPSRGITDRSGRYDLSFTRERRGALIGRHVVRIATQTEGTTPNGRSDNLSHLAPPKSGKTWQLTTEVKPGNNRLDFELDADPAATGARRPAQPQSSP